RAPMCANDFLLFSFFEGVHYRTIPGGPVAFRQAMHEDDVELFGAELAAEAVEVGTHLVGVPRPRFCEYRDFCAIEMFESLGDVGMAPVRVGSVEESEAVFVKAVEQEP